MTATGETVVGKVKEIEDLCNVPSIASALKLSVNLVKRFFPLDAVESVTTSECDGNFVVRLRRSNSSKDQEQLINPSTSIWSHHGYQKPPQEQLAVAKRNSRYLLLLNDRPSPVIDSDTTSRKLGQNSAVPDLKTEVKASSSEFFGNKTVTTSGTAAKKSPSTREPQTFFQKKQKTEDNKGTKTEGKVKAGTIKQETPPPEKQKTAESEATNGENPDVKNVKKKSCTSEATDPDPEALKTESTKDTKSPKTESTKKTKSPKAESMKSTKSTNAASKNVAQTPKAAPVEKTSKTKKVAPPEDSSEKSSTENKRKRIEDTSEDEDVIKSSRGKKKKLKRVAILDSDSDDGNEDKGEDAENADDDCMDTSESPVKKTKKSRTKTEKSTPDKKTNGNSSSKKNPKRTSPLKAFTKKETEKESTSDAQKGKANGQQQRRRRRVLKEVTHTFKSEDGFLETKTVKEMVSETDSEPEEGTAPKNKATAKSVSVASTPAPRGQASLLSFFKKK